MPRWIGLSPRVGCAVAVILGLTGAILLFIFFKKLFQKARSKPSPVAMPPPPPSNP